MLIEKDKSGLVIIDVQEKLVSVMPKPHTFIDNIIKLITAANHLEIPVEYSEQYPKGLGNTIKKIQECHNYYKNPTIFKAREKTSFAIPDFPEAEHYIVCGIEAHICVLQTAFNLIKKINTKEPISSIHEKRRVFIVQDAISSRYEKDYLTALSRLDKHPNIEIVTTEMVLFEWLRNSKHKKFKEISSLIK